MIALVLCVVAVSMGGVFSPAEALAVAKETGFTSLSSYTFSTIDKANCGNDMAWGSCRQLPRPAVRAPVPRKARRQRSPRELGKSRQQERQRGRLPPRDPRMDAKCTLYPIPLFPHTAFRASLHSTLEAASWFGHFVTTPECFTSMANVCKVLFHRFSGVSVACSRKPLNASSVRGCSVCQRLPNSLFQLPSVVVRCLRTPQSSAMRIFDQGDRHYTVPHAPLERC